ncbi:hypothetical protein P3T76_008982 [Phytophthora citrophthora]|uniref:GAF domain-containing protein n=1 Tax=Phytophthora citrophthora TaxID=4793 RepID=A0AAD9GI64_9STRA|nr:hypothetical protein P3T76_008982 [Phytophthora citrophthora]
MQSGQEGPPIRSLRTWGRSQPIALSMNMMTDNAISSESSVTASDANFSRFSMSQLTIEPRSSPDRLLSDRELFRRARNVHTNTDFNAIAAIEDGRAWQVIETVDRFSILRRHDSQRRTLQREPHTEVLCAGRLDASLDEVTRILCPDSEAEHNATMRGLYDKNFIFGTIDRCWNADTDTDATDGEQLALKTSSFVHTKPFGHNEQWCYLDFFQRNPERDGFTISQRSLRSDESTPGRVAGDHARVHQLHRLAASYLVVQLPDRKGLRVVFHCWFDPVGTNLSCHGRPRSLSDSNTVALNANSRREAKAQYRRLLAMARGVAQLPAYLGKAECPGRKYTLPVLYLQSISRQANSGNGSLGLETVEEEALLLVWVSRMWCVLVNSSNGDRSGPYSVYRGVYALQCQHQAPWGGSMSSNDPNSPSSPTPTILTQLSDDDIQQESVRSIALSDGEMLERARAAHDREDFTSLSAGPEANGPWKRVESVDSFVVFRRPAVDIQDGRYQGLEVMCAGRLDASIEEVSSILRSNSESEHNASMSALYSKSFIFGSYEREVSVQKGDRNEQLVVKTKSFARTTMLGHNEQWCYFDFFKRKQERDGFTISKRALPPSEVTPGRIVGSNAHVDQLHGLNASYLVDKLPDRKGLRVVFRAWFDSEKEVDSSNRRRTSSNPASTPRPNLDHKAQLRRLLAMAHGMTKIPELVRRRRFGVQVPAKLGAIETFNSRCPCCTHSLAPVKLSLSKAASAIKNRSLSSFKMDTRRCYLCGYLVCVDCWTSEHMESFAGRVAAIVVCTRCHANVQACEYSEVFAGTAEERERHRGPPRVVEDSNNSTTISLLIDFLSASLLNAAAGSHEHAAVVTVIRTLLNLDEENCEDNQAEIGFQVLKDSEVNKLEGFLTDEEKLPMLEDCKLGNADERSYPLDLPDDPTVDVPQSPIPSNETERMASIKSEGLLEIANIFAPETPLSANITLPDVHDLELLCSLAVKTLGCEYSFVTIMCAKHEHVVVGTHPGFVGSAVPRAQTTCQHALMSPYPFMAAHHEADVRFHKQGATSAIPTRFYVGFPLTVDGKKEDVTVGMLCCIGSKPRAEITRTQYATMKRLASTASHFLLQKSRQLQQQENLLPSGGCL